MHDLKPEVNYFFRNSLGIRELQKLETGHQPHRSTNSSTLNLQSLGEIRSSNHMFEMKEELEQNPFQVAEEDVESFPLINDYQI